MASASFSIKKADLAAAMNRCAPVASRRSTLPVLSHVHVAVGGVAVGGEAIFTATDLEVGVRVVVPVEMEESEELANGLILVLPGRKLAEMARELPAGDVRITSDTESGRAMIVAGSCRFQLSMMSPEDFPVWDAVIGERTEGEWRVDSGRFVEMVDAVLFAASDDTSRYNLNAVSVEFGNGDEGQEIPVRFVTTDGHRLASITLRGARNGEDGGAASGNGNSLSGRVLIPKSGALELRRVANSVSGEIVVRRTEKNVIVESVESGAVVAVRLLDGDYPPYQKVIPTKHDMRFTVNREALLGALKRVSLLSSDRNMGATVDLSPFGVFGVEIAHSDLGTARDEVNVETEGGVFAAGVEGGVSWRSIFNVGYLMEAVNSVKADNVTVEITEEGPAVFRPRVNGGGGNGGSGEDNGGESDTGTTGGTDQFCLVMPMRK